MQAYGGLLVWNHFHNDFLAGILFERINKIGESRTRKGFTDTLTGSISAVRIKMQHFTKPGMNENRLLPDYF